MLTSQHALIEFTGGRAIPDKLTRRTHRQYTEYAERMLAVYRTGVGKTRRALRQAVETIFASEPDCHSRRIQAFCKLLEDRSVFQSDPHAQAAKLRLQVFDLAARSHPLVRQTDRLFGHQEQDVKRQIAEALGRPWPDLERDLYADIMDYQRLELFDGYPAPLDLLRRYNEAQLQACLYRATRLVLIATQDFKTIFRYAKLARLLHDVTRLGPSKYRIEFSGPASVLDRTRRYGVQLARFLPAVLACRGWALQAWIQTPWPGQMAILELSGHDGFTGHLPPPEEFDSSVEQSFAEKFGECRDGWRLEREGEILCQNQKVFLPDFVFRHESGPTVFLEIAGYWTPEYLAKKRETLQTFQNTHLLLAVPHRSVRTTARPSENVILYKTKLNPQPVLTALNRFLTPTTPNPDH